MVSFMFWYGQTYVSHITVLFSTSELILYLQWVGSNPVVFDTFPNILSRFKINGCSALEIVIHVGIHQLYRIQWLALGHQSQPTNLAFIGVSQLSIRAYILSYSMTSFKVAHKVLQKYPNDPFSTKFLFFNFCNPIMTLKQGSHAQALVRLIVLLQLARQLQQFDSQQLL